jgi:beta-lactam-binding protein with PASTA domain
MSNETEDAESPKPSALAWLGSQDWVLAAALAFFVGIAVWFGRSIQDFLAPSGQEVLAPSLVGQTARDAVDEAGRLHLRAIVVERSPSESFPKDVVLRQEPKAGTNVREGRQISLVVSTGMQVFPMPDFRYETMREVNVDLSHYRLQLGKIRTVPSDDVPANHVAAQDPPALSSARVGSVVNIDLSAGTASAARVPNFVGMTVDGVRAATAHGEVKLGQVVWTPFGRSGAPRGTVVRQAPAAGARADSLTRVSLQVSAGPGEAGYIVRQVHATAAVPAGDKPVKVRIEVRDETGTWDLYNAYAQPRQKLDFNLTAIGSSEIDMYVDNELLSATKLAKDPSARTSANSAPMEAPL